MRKPSLATWAGVLGIAFATAVVPAQAVEARHSSCRATQPDATLVIDFDTGTILKQDRADQKRIPASLTKMMTLLVVMEALDQGTIKESDMITISGRAASNNLYDNRTPVRRGDQISVREAIAGLITLSSNKLSIALAEHIAGTESAFVDMMNDRASTLGMDDTIFADSHGLDDTIQRSTGYDMARLTSHIIRHHDDKMDYFTNSRFSHRGTVRNGGSTFTNRYNDVDVSKTGYVCQSGHNLIASSEKNGRRIIAVIFGRHGSAYRNQDMRRILDQAHKNADRIITAAQSQIIRPTQPPDRSPT